MNLTGKTPAELRTIAANMENDAARRGYSGALDREEARKIRERATAMEKGRQIMQYNSMVTSMSGVLSAEWTARFVWIETTDNGVVRVSRANLKAQDRWSAFYLADLAKAHAKKKWCHVRFPLVENGIYREAAKRILRERFGLPWEAPRSACVCCPYHDHEEWYRIFTVPEDWERAVQIDRALRAPGSIAARGLVQKLYLHRSCRPLESLDLAALLRADRNDRQADIFAGNVGFRGNCEGVCGT